MSTNDQGEDSVFRKVSQLGYNLKPTPHHYLQPLVLPSQQPQHGDGSPTGSPSHIIAATALPGSAYHGTAQLSTSAGGSWSPGSPSTTLRPSAGQFLFTSGAVKTGGKTPRGSSPPSTLLPLLSPSRLFSAPAASVYLDVNTAISAIQRGTVSPIQTQHLHQQRLAQPGSPSRSGPLRPTSTQHHPAQLQSSGSSELTPHGVQTGSATTAAAPNYLNGSRWSPSSTNRAVTADPVGPKRLNRRPDSCPVQAAPSSPLSCQSPQQLPTAGTIGCSSLDFSQEPGAATAVRRRKSWDSNTNLPSSPIFEVALKAWRDNLEAGVYGPRFLGSWTAVSSGHITAATAAAHRSSNPMAPSANCRAMSPKAAAMAAVFQGSGEEAVQALEQLVQQKLVAKPHLTLLQLQRGIQAVSQLEVQYQLAATGVMLRGGCWAAAMQVGYADLSVLAEVLVEMRSIIETVQHWNRQDLTAATWYWSPIDRDLFMRSFRGLGLVSQYQQLRKQITRLQGGSNNSTRPGQSAALGASTVVGQAASAMINDTNVGSRSSGRVDDCHPVLAKAECMLLVSVIDDYLANVDAVLAAQAAAAAEQTVEPQQQGYSVLAVLDEQTEVEGHEPGIPTTGSGDGERTCGSMSSELAPTLQIGSDWRIVSIGADNLNTTQHEQEEDQHQESYQMAQHEVFSIPAPAVVGSSATSTPPARLSIGSPSKADGQSGAGLRQAAGTPDEQPVAPEPISLPSMPVDAVMSHSQWTSKHSGSNAMRGNSAAATGAASPHPSQQHARRHSAEAAVLPVNARAGSAVQSPALFDNSISASAVLAMQQPGNEQSLTSTEEQEQTPQIEQQAGGRELPEQAEAAEHQSLQLEQSPQPGQELQEQDIADPEQHEKQYDEQETSHVAQQKEVTDRAACAVVYTSASPTASAPQFSDGPRTEADTNLHAGQQQPTESPAEQPAAPEALSLPSVADDAEKKEQSGLMAAEELQTLQREQQPSQHELPEQAEAADHQHLQLQQPEEPQHVHQSGLGVQHQQTTIQQHEEPPVDQRQQLHQSSLDLQHQQTTTHQHEKLAVEQPQHAHQLGLDLQHPQTMTQQHEKLAVEQPQHVQSSGLDIQHQQMTQHHKGPTLEQPQHLHQSDLDIKQKQTAAQQHEEAPVAQPKQSRQSGLDIQHQQTTVQQSEEAPVEQPKQVQESGLDIQHPQIMPKQHEESAVEQPQHVQQSGLDGQHQQTTTQQHVEPAVEQPQHVQQSGLDGQHQQTTPQQHEKLATEQPQHLHQSGLDIQQKQTTVHQHEEAPLAQPKQVQQSGLDIQHQQTTPQQFEEAPVEQPKQVHQSDLDIQHPQTTTQQHEKLAVEHPQHVHLSGMNIQHQQTMTQKHEQPAAEQLQHLQQSGLDILHQETSAQQHEELTVKQPKQVQGQEQLEQMQVQQQEHEQQQVQQQAIQQEPPLLQKHSILPPMEATNVVMAETRQVQQSEAVQQQEQDQQVQQQEVQQKPRESLLQAEPALPPVEAGALGVAESTQVQQSETVAEPSPQQQLLEELIVQGAEVELSGLGSSHLLQREPSSSSAALAVGAAETGSTQHTPHTIAADTAPPAPTPASEPGPAAQQMVPACTAADIHNTAAEATGTESSVSVTPGNSILATELSTVEAEPHHSLLTKASMSEQASGLPPVGPTPQQPGAAPGVRLPWQQDNHPGISDTTAVMKDSSDAAAADSTPGQQLQQSQLDQQQPHMPSEPCTRPQSRQTSRRNSMHTSRPASAQVRLNNSADILREAGLLAVMSRSRPASAAPAAYAANGPGAIWSRPGTAGGDCRSASRPLRPQSAAAGDSCVQRLVLTSRPGSAAAGTRTSSSSPRFVGPADATEVGLQRLRDTCAEQRKNMEQMVQTLVAADGSTSVPLLSTAAVPATPGSPRTVSSPRQWSRSRPQSAHRPSGTGAAGFAVSTPITEHAAAAAQLQDGSTSVVTASDTEDDMLSFSPQLQIVPEEDSKFQLGLEVSQVRRLSSDHSAAGGTGACGAQVLAGQAPAAAGMQSEHQAVQAGARTECQPRVQSADRALPEDLQRTMQLFQQRLEQTALMAQQLLAQQVANQAARTGRTTNSRPGSPAVPAQQAAAASGSLSTRGIQAAGIGSTIGSDSSNGGEGLGFGLTPWKLADLGVEELTSADEVAEYATYLGIDLVQDADLLYIAEGALAAQCPDGWTIHLDKEGNEFFFNAETQASTYEHPMDEHYRRMYQERKQQKAQHQKSQQQIHS